MNDILLVTLVTIQCIHTLVLITICIFISKRLSRIDEKLDTLIEEAKEFPAYIR